MRIASMRCDDMRPLRTPDMNVLLLSSRHPWPPFTGDRLRATIWIAALQKIANVALVAPDGPAPGAGCRFYPASRSIGRAAAGVVDVLRGAPVQSLLAAPFDWRGAIARALADHGGFDATIVLLSRLDRSVRDLLPPGIHVLDAIDSLRRSSDERARNASPPLRWFWREESRRVARVERDASRAYDTVVVVGGEGEAEELNATAVPSGIDIAPLGDAPRRFDFAFWGRLAYFANADAASWLVDEIWPLIRERIPHATLFLGGAAAPARIRALHGRSGITVQSPIDDVAALARQARIAIFPVRYGTGQSTKMLEAAEGGCAVVATAKAVRGLGPLARHASVANDASGLAGAAVALLIDERRRADMARALRATVETTYSREETLQRLAAIVSQRKAAA